MADGHKTESPEEAPEPDNAESAEDQDGLQKLTAGGSERESVHMGARLRNYFLTGLVVVGPVGITLYVLWWFVTLIDAWVKPLLPARYLPETYLPFSIPGIGLIFSVMVLMVVGAFTANLFGRTLLSYGESLLGRMPVVRNVYRALKQIFETVLSQSSSSFQKVGLIEYPREGLYAIVFISTTTKGEIDSRIMKGEKLLSVFLPTTPNPTSGFLLFVPEKDVIVLDMSVEEGAKMVISAGLVVPEHQQKLQDLAKDASKRKPAPRRVSEKEPAE